MGSSQLSDRWPFFRLIQPGQDQPNKHADPAAQVVIDVQVDAAAGALGFFPNKWPPGPVVVGAVLPGKIADDHGVCEGDLLWLVEGRRCSAVGFWDLVSVSLFCEACLWVDISH